MLKNIEPPMRSPRHSLFCARHSPRFSSRPLTHAVLVTRAAGVQAAAVHALLWPPPRSGAAATRRFSGSRRARTARPEFFSPPAVKGSLRSARVGVVEVVMNVHFCTFSVGLPWAWCPSPGKIVTFFFLLQKWRDLGALITVVTVLFHLSHGFDFSEGQNQIAALGIVHPSQCQDPTWRWSSPAAPPRTRRQKLGKTVRLAIAIAGGLPTLLARALSSS